MIGQAEEVYVEETAEQAGCIDLVGWDNSVEPTA
jgi:hypothetical protein